jgi:HEAT repeat protein
MGLKLEWPRLGLRELLLLAALGGVLVYALVPIRSGQASDPVGEHLAMLRKGTSAAERSHAATALARMAEKNADRIIPELIQATADREAPVRQAAVDALHVVRADQPWAAEAIGSVTAALQDSDPQVRATAAGVLSTFKPPPLLAIPGLIEAATSGVDASAAIALPSPPIAGRLAAQNSIDRNRQDHARASAVAALAVIGRDDAEAQKLLVRLAGDPVPEVRMVVARALGDLGPKIPGAFAALVKLTADSDMYIQARAVTALGSFRQDYVTSCPILYRAYRSKQRPLQEGAELSLAEIVKSPAFDAKAAWQSKDPSLRFAAVFGLDPGSKEGMPAILQALKDEDSGVRLLAVTRMCSASAARAEAALKAIEPLANDTDADVRNQVRYSQRLLAPKLTRAPATPDGH